MRNLTKADKGAKLSTTQVRLRKVTASMRMREFELAEKEGTMVAAADAANTWASIGAKLQAAVLGLPSKCAEAVAAAKTAREAEGLLRAECESILKALADDLAPVTIRR